MTILELILTTVTMFIILGVFLIRMDGDNKEYRELHTAALQLQSDIRYAQRRAVTEGRNVFIQFEYANNCYHIYASEPVPILFRTVDFSNGVELYNNTHRNNRITYQPRGTIVAPGTVTLRNGRHTRRITTTLSGGRVFVDNIDGA